MTEKIIIPIETPGATQSADQVARLEKSVAALHRQSAQGRDSMAGFGSALQNVSGHSRKAADDHDKHKLTLEGLEKQLKKSGEAGGKFAELFGSFAGGFGAIGVAAKAVGDIIGQVMGQIDRDIERTSQETSKITDAMNHAASTIRDARAALSKDDSATIMAHGQGLRALAAVGGDTAVAQAQKFAADNGVDVQAVGSVLTEAKKRGLSDEETNNVLQSALQLNRQGRMEFGQAGKAAAGLGSERLKHNISEISSDALNAEEIRRSEDAKGRQVSPAEAAKKADEESARIANIKSNLEEEYYKKHDAKIKHDIDIGRTSSEGEQETLDEYIARNLPQMAYQQPEDIKRAPGTSAADIALSDRNVRESQTAAICAAV